MDIASDPPGVVCYGRWMGRRFAKIGKPSEEVPASRISRIGTVYLFHGTVHTVKPGYKDTSGPRVISLFTRYPNSQEKHVIFDILIVVLVYSIILTRLSLK